MKIEFNPTGTHLRNGFLKIRLDLYPELNDKTYPLHYVDHYDRELTQAEMDDSDLAKLVPTHKEVNPCLCHFLIIDPDMTNSEVIAYAKTIFDGATMLELDNILSEVVLDKTRLSHLMSMKLGKGKKTQLPLAILKDKFVGLRF